MNTQAKYDLGTVKIHTDVIASIAAIAALEIEGVKAIYKGGRLSILELLNLKGSRGIRVDFGKNDEMRLDIPLVIKYGYSIPEIAEGIQENIRQALEKMLDKSPRDINISIRGVEKG